MRENLSDSGGDGSGTGKADLELAVDVVVEVAMKAFLLTVALV